MGSIHESSRPRMRRRTLVIAMALLVLLLAATAVQAARSGMTWRDLFEEPELLVKWQESSSETEMDLYPDLEVAPGETDAAIDRLGADIPLPPGGNWDRVRAAFNEPTYIGELGLRSMLEGSAGQQWMCHWLENTESGDSDAVRDATEALAVLPESPVLDAVDGGGTIEYWTRVANAAEASDVGTMAQLGTHCDPNAPPPGI